MSPPVAFAFTITASGISLLHDDGIEMNGPEINTIYGQGLIWICSSLRYAESFISKLTLSFSFMDGGEGEEGSQTYVIAYILGTWPLETLSTVIGRSKFRVIFQTFSLIWSVHRYFIAKIDLKIGIHLSKGLLFSVFANSFWFLLSYYCSVFLFFLRSFSVSKGAEGGGLGGNQVMLTLNSCWPFSSIICS